VFGGQTQQDTPDTSRAGLIVPVTSGGGLWRVRAPMPPTALPYVLAHLSFSNVRRRGPRGEFSDGGRGAARGQGGCFIAWWFCRWPWVVTLPSDPCMGPVDHQANFASMPGTNKISPGEKM